MFCGKLLKILKWLNLMESNTFMPDSFNTAERIVNDIVDESSSEILVPVYIPQSTWKDKHFLLRYIEYTVEALVCLGESIEDFDHPEFWDKENFKIFTYSIWVAADPLNERMTKDLGRLAKKYPHCAGGKTQIEFNSLIDMIWDAVELFKDIDANG